MTRTVWRLTAVAAVFLAVAGMGVAAAAVTDTVEQSSDSQSSYSYSDDDHLGMAIVPLKEVKIQSVNLYDGSEGNNDIQVRRYYKGNSSYGPNITRVSAGTDKATFSSEPVLEKDATYAILQLGGDQGYDVDTEGYPDNDTNIRWDGRIDNGGYTINNDYVRVFWEITTEEKNDSPAINSNSTEPATIGFGDSPNLTANVTDSDRNLDAVTATVRENGTVILDNATLTDNDADDVFNLTDAFTADEADVWYNTTFYANDTDGALSSAENNQFIADNPPTVAFNSPGNATTYRYETTLNATVDDDLSDSVNASIILDGNRTQSVNQTVLYFLVNTTSMGAGQHNITVRATDDAGQITAVSRFFTIDRFALMSNASDSTVYETANTSYNATMTVGSMVNDLETTLFWNGTVRDTATWTGSGVRNESVIHWFRPSLVTVNQTNTSWRIQYTANYTRENGSQTTEAHNTTAGTQEVWEAFVVDSFGITQDRVIEAQDLDAAFTNTTLVPDTPAHTNSSITYNGTKKAGNTVTFRAPVLPNQSTQKASTSASGATTVSYRSRSKTLTTGSDTVTVHNKILTDCSAGSASQTTALRFVTRNEENNSEKVPADVDYNLDTTITGRNTDNFAFSRTGKQIDTCIYPTWAEYRVTGPIQYSAQNYSDRTYNLYNISITNQTSLYNLYLLPNTFSTPIYFQVQENDGTAVSGATIKVMRYYIGKDSYLTVAKSVTDSEGVSSSYMRVNEIYYKYLISKNGEVLLETERQILQCQTSPCTKTFVIDPETVSPYFQKKESFAYNCRVNSATDTANASVQCTVDHTTGSMEEAQLLVEERQVVGANTYCNISVINTGESMVCELGNTSQNVYQYKLFGTKDDTTYTLATDVVDNTVALFAGNAVYAAFVVFLAITGLGLFSPAAGIMFSMLGFLAAAWLQLLSLGAASVAGVVVVAMIAAMEAKR